MNVFCFPIRHQNKIIEINKEIIESLGHQVYPLKSVYQPKFFFDFDKAVILNWVEDQPYIDSYGFFKSWIYFFFYLTTIICCKLTSRKIIWIKHNFKPHINKKFSYRHMITCYLMNIFNIKETTLEDYVGAHYIPHPLYLDDEELTSLAESCQTTNKIKVTFFGHIKRYKGLHQALRIWPKDIPLSICGKIESPNYKRELLDIVNRRNINVVINEGFVEDSELENLLLETSHVFLPHEANTMISSGSFYHAITYGCNILATKSAFSMSKFKEHNFISISNLGSVNLNTLQRSVVQRREVMSDALDHYSRVKIRKSWNFILNS